LAQPHILRLRQLLGETLDAHRHRLDLSDQRGVLGTEVVDVGTQDLVFASERGNRLRDSSALQAAWRWTPGEIHGGLTLVLVAEAGEARANRADTLVAHNAPPLLTARFVRAV